MVNDGGPAFPCGDQRQLTVGAGMSLRDYFAAKAMAEIMSSMADAKYQQNEIAKRAYAQADAMLEARKK